MRLIDADALKANVPDTSADTFENCRNCKTLMDWQVKELIDQQPTISPWHRVEEPPKEVGCYLVVGFDRHWFYDIAEYFPIDNEWAMSENQPDSTYIRYWMHMPEPPKEDA